MCFRARLSDMSTLAASHFVSRTSHVNGGSGSETRTNLGQMGLWNQPMTHNGLRSLSNLDMLRIKTRPNAVPRQAMKKADKTEGDQCVGKIVCGTGMNLVFVGAEVGPWSKTGGLGDVLGGLPPALAVCELLEFDPCFSFLWFSLTDFCAWWLISRLTGTVLWPYLHAMINTKMHGILVYWLR